MAPSPTPWMMCTVYQDAACSIPWAPRTERWYRLDACAAVNDGGSFWKSSNSTHLETKIFSDTNCTTLVEPSIWTELGRCLGGAGGWTMQVPAVKPDLLPNTIVHHFTNAADCSSEPMIVETYAVDQCYMPNHMGIFQAVMCDLPKKKITALSHCRESSCNPSFSANYTTGCTLPHEEFICNVTPHV